jgi:hypothetical protein
MNRNDLAINLLRYLHAHGEPARIGFENGEPVVVVGALSSLPPVIGPIPGAWFVAAGTDGTATLESRP